jgi:aminoglycoside phosphotransferase (APT) family kinase protein
MEEYSSDELERLAAAIFCRHGVDFSEARRASGWTNAVWFTHELVLRLSTRKEDPRLIDEAALSACFPPEVGAPRVIEWGREQGHAWTLACRVPGKSLGEAWDGLDAGSRAAALKEVWAKARAIHSVSLQALPMNISRRAWFNSVDPQEAEDGLARVTRQELLSPTEAAELRINLERLWEALPAAACVLCHGDLTLDNAIWHEGQVTALLDFEFAVLAPVQLDLNQWVKVAFGPEPPVTNVLWQTVKEAARLILKRPEERVLLSGYAILLELWKLEDYLAHPEGEGPVEQWDPLRRLRALADGGGGYLAPLYVE